MRIDAAIKVNNIDAPAEILRETYGFSFRGKPNSIVMGEANK